MATTSSLNRTGARSDRSATESAWPRWVSIALGGWLFLSAWFWPHASSSATNTILLGLIIAGVGIIALWSPAMRWVNTAAAVWLFISTFAVDHVSSATVWNNAIVAVVVFVVSLIPSGSVTVGSRRGDLASSTV